MIIIKRSLKIKKVKQIIAYIANFLKINHGCERDKSRYLCIVILKDLSDHVIINQIMRYFYSKKIRIIIITYVILMQAVHSPTSAFYYYSSPVKSEPDTETDESQPTVLRPTDNLLDLGDHGRSKVKSSLCKNFATQGYCPYGRKCQFAHGPQELRCNENINISYKTKPCFSFRKQGFCPYGHRCNFQHRDQKAPLINFNINIISNFPEMILTMGGAQSKLVSKLASLTNN